MKKAVYCIAKTTAQAEMIVDRLKVAGFSSNDISVLFPDQSTSKDFAHEKSTKAPEGATAGGMAGMGVGGILGWVAGFGSLVIPGLGPFVAAGPIVAALSGAAVGAAAGGIIGALIGLGIPEYEAKRYEGKIKAGNVLIAVHTEDSEERERVENIFEASGAEDISASLESTPA